VPEEKPKGKKTPQTKKTPTDKKKENDNKRRKSKQIISSDESSDEEEEEHNEDKKKENQKPVEVVDVVFISIIITMQTALLKTRGPRANNDNASTHSRFDLIFLLQFWKFFIFY